MNSQTLAGHSITGLLLENLKPMLGEAGNALTKLAEEGEIRNREQVTLSEKEFYDYDVFRRFSKVIGAFERLEASQRIIEKAPRSSWESAGFDRHTWIEYHYSYYVLTLVSIADIATLLTNAVFRLGNRERDCKADIVIKNWWVTQTPAKGALEELSKLVNPHKAGRNIHVHRGELQSIAEVMGSEMLDRLELVSSAQRFGKPVADPVILDRAYEAEIQKIAGTLSQERSEICGSVVQLLDALFAVYAVKSAALRAKQKAEGATSDALR